MVQQFTSAGNIRILTLQIGNWRVVALWCCWRLNCKLSVREQASELIQQATWSEPYSIQ